MLRRRCTAGYKINGVEQAIRRRVFGLEYRQRMPRNVKVVPYFGLSHDEPRRVARVKARFVGHPRGEARFPLLDDQMTRADRVAYLQERAIPHEVPRIACVFCPFRSNFEWRHLQASDPAGWARAMEVDEVLGRPGTVANREPGAEHVPPPVLPASGLWWASASGT